MASILVVDDSAIVLETTSAMLALEQHHVWRAANAKDALVWLQEKKVDIDLLITDIVLPDMTGMELIKEALEYRPSMPVIVMTGYSREGSKELVWTLVDLGIRDILRKPFTRTELISAVNRALLKQRPK